MANASKVMEHIKKWEGGFSNNPNDTGGATMYGITLKTFRSFYGQDKTVDDLKKITSDQWLNIFRTGYWNKMKGDNIENQSIATLIADMVWMSGVTTALKKCQAVLGLKADGIIGPKSIAAFNKNTKETFTKLWNMRKSWLEQISCKGNNKVFLKGWLNRLNSIKYE